MAVNDTARGEADGSPGTDRSLCYEWLLTWLATALRRSAGVKYQ